MRLAFDDQSLQVKPGLLQFRRTGSGARFQFCDALLVGYLPRGRALQVHGSLVGARVGVFGARIQLIAARHAGRVLTLERAHMLGALLDLRSQFGDLDRQGCLLAIHLRDAAGQYHAQPGAHFVAESGIAFCLRRLPLERTHLPGNFFEDVVDPRQILFGLFQAKFG